jgi:hypothetical protein
MAAEPQLEVMIMSAIPRAAGRLVRLARLLIGSNKLRRPSDRFEGAVIATLLAAFLAAVTMASLVSAHIYQSERAAESSLHPVIAVLTENGPIDVVDGAGEARARWRVPDGKERSSMLSTVIAPGIGKASRGSRVRIWITRDGDWAFLILCYWLSRLILDRRRLTAWEAAWARVGPRWTTHR